MHKQLEQQVRLSIAEGKLDPDILVRLVDSSYREADIRAQMMIDRLNDAVLVLDEANQLVDINPAGRKIFHIPQGPLGAYKLEQFIPALSVDESLKSTQGAVLAKKNKVDCQTLSGEQFIGDVNLFVLKVAETGRFVCIIRSAPAVIKVVPKEQADHKPAKSTEVQEKYLAMMSHELRTPMNAVLGMAKHLANTKMDEEQLESVKTIIDAGDVMMSLLNDLLDKSKLDAGKLSLENIHVDLRHMLRKLVRLWRPSIEEKGLAFSLKISDDVPSVILGDSVRIRQILSNLLSNAAKFTKTGSVTLSVEASPIIDGEVEIDFIVRDTGVGISDEVQAKLFSAYAQADSSTAREFGGTGLGLSISRQLAQMMGGDIDVDSKVGLGSDFHFIARFTAISKQQNNDNSIQYVESKPSRPESQKTQPKGNTNSSSAKPVVAKISDDSLRILAVEDNPINQRVLAAFLRPIGGDVVWAGNGQEALDLLETDHFDVVLMDIQMPVMDGLTAAKEIRARNSRNCTVPIIAMTANAMLGDRDTCLAAGMDDYISKPIDPKTLYKSIARLVDQARAGKEQVANVN